MSIVPFLGKVNNLILNPLITLAFAVSLVIFIIGVIKFLSLDPGDSKRKEAQNSIIWGIVGMLIMFSVFGLIRFVLTTFGASPNSVPYLQGKL